MPVPSKDPRPARAVPASVGVPSAARQFDAIPTTIGTRSQLRAFLGAMESTALAALLRDMGIELYNREIREWRVLTEISDELLDRETVAARGRLVDRWLAGLPVVQPPPVALPSPRKPRAPAPFTEDQRETFRDRRKARRKP